MSARETVAAVNRVRWISSAGWATKIDAVFSMQHHRSLLGHISLILTMAGVLASAGR